MFFSKRSAAKHSPRSVLSVLSLCFALSSTLTACDIDDDEAGAQDVQAISIDEVIAAQDVWGQGIVKIGQAYAQQGDYQKVAADHVNTLYAYDIDEVLFKPTKAVEKQFRLNKADALSYFVTGVVPEDKGFALQPWSAVRFVNAGIIIRRDTAIAMGNYFFTDAKTGTETKVEYTFGYIRNEAGDLVINLHHSSLPFSG